MASIFQQAKDIESQVVNILATFDLDYLPKQQKELVISIRHQVIDARLDARDYEYAETREEQLRIAKEGKERLTQLEKTILKASEYNVFSAIDTAQISARIGQLISQMD